MSTPLMPYEGLNAVTLAAERTLDVPMDGVSQVCLLVSVTNAGTSGAATLTMVPNIIGPDAKLYPFTEEDVSSYPSVVVTERPYLIDMTATAEHLVSIFLPAPGTGTARLVFNSDVAHATDILNVYVLRAAL